MAHIPRTMVVGAGAGAGAGYAWARHQGQKGKEAAITTGKGALAGAAAGGAVGLGLSVRRRKAARKAIPAALTMRELAKGVERVASEAVERVEETAGPMLGQAQETLERRGREARKGRREG